MKTTDWEKLEISSRKLDTKGTFYSKMGTIKEKNSKDVTEAQEIKKRWQEYTEELCKKGLNDPDNHNGMFTQSQTSQNAKTSGPQGALPGIKVVEVMEFQLSYFKS